MKEWLVVRSPSSVQVVPLDDLIVHVPSEACTCAPRVDLVQGHTCRGKQYLRRMMIHEAMDGRE